MHNFKELALWQKARLIVKTIYDVTSKFPESEKYVLTSQMRRAGISIPSNIAEGAGSDSNREFKRYLGIAMSSSYELETQIYLSLDLGYLFQSEMDNLIEKLNEVQRMIVGLRNKLD